MKQQAQNNIYVVSILLTLVMLGPRVEMCSQIEVVNHDIKEHFEGFCVWNSESEHGNPLKFI